MFFPQLPYFLGDNDSDDDDDDDDDDGDDDDDYYNGNDFFQLPSPCCIVFFSVSLSIIYLSIISLFIC